MCAVEVDGSDPKRSELTEQQTDLVFKALSSRPRREILALLASGASEDNPRCCSPDEVCACVFVEKLGLGAPTVSHHMKSLMDAGLVTSDKRGSWVYYRLRTDTLRCVANEMLALVGCYGGKCS